MLLVRTAMNQMLYPMNRSLTRYMLRIGAMTMVATVNAPWPTTNHRAGVMNSGDILNIGMRAKIMAKLRIDRSAQIRVMRQIVA